jgi:ribosome maturation factor RimP
MSAAQVRALRSLAEPIVAQFDCDLEDVVIRPAGKRRLVRVVVDHPGGLPMDLVASIARAISRELDARDPLGQSAYVLEVTSPGVDRPLTLPRHWARAVGRLVLVRPREGEPFEGRVQSAGEGAATLEVDGSPREVRYDRVARAVVQVEFTRVDDVDLEDVDAEDVEPDEVDAVGPDGDPVGDGED